MWGQTWQSRIPSSREEWCRAPASASGAATGMGESPSQWVLVSEQVCWDCFWKHSQTLELRINFCCVDTEHHHDNRDTNESKEDRTHLSTSLTSKIHLVCLYGQRHLVRTHVACRGMALSWQSRIVKGGVSLGNYRWLLLPTFYTLHLPLTKPTQSQSSVTMGGAGSSLRPTGGWLAC